MNDLTQPRFAYVMQGHYTRQISAEAFFLLDTIERLGKSEIPGEVVRIEGLTFADFAPAAKEDA